MEQRENVENNVKRLQRFRKLRPRMKTKEHAPKENTKGKHLPTPCEGRTLKELGRLARCSLDDGL